MTYIFDKSTTPIIMPGTGSTIGIISIIVAVIGLCAGGMLLLTEKDTK